VITWNDVTSDFCDVPTEWGVSHAFSGSAQKYDLQLRCPTTEFQAGKVSNIFLDVDMGRIKEVRYYCQSRPNQVLFTKVSMQYS
jgi:hypothetical protein